MVSRYSRGADQPRRPPKANGVLDRSSVQRGVRHRHGLYRPADPEQLFADFAEVNILRTSPFLLGWLALAIAAALAAIGTAEQDSQKPLFDLYTADAEVASGPLQQLSDDWSVTLGGDKPVQANGAQVIALRRKQTAIPGAPEREHVILLNGDQIPGRLLQVVGERVRLQAQIGTGQEL